MISYATPYHLLQPDKLSTHTVAPDLAWSLPGDINDAVQKDNDTLINMQLFLFPSARLKFKHAPAVPRAPLSEEEEERELEGSWSG